MSVRLVNVTPEAAIYFLHNGGFAMYEQPALGPIDFVPNTRVRHPDGLSCGWRGVAYDPDEDGDCMVPAAAVADLEPHGFMRLPAKAEVAVESLTEAPVESLPAEEGTESGDDQPRGRRGRKN